MRPLLFVAAIACLLTSCYAYKVFPVEARHYTYDGPRQKAYVTNPGLKNEYQIFIRSNIFELTADSTDASATKIKLHKIERPFVCGQAIVASAFFLGQLPVYLPDRYFFKFDQMEGEAIRTKKFELKIATRYWFWDMFGVKKNFKKKAGQLLCYEYYSPQPAARR